jgi:phospholipid/cholesterol/gamma-HCH transport system substrate-binding protein
MNRKYVSLGLFVVISVGLLLWLAQSVGALGSPPGKTYTVRLDNAAGLVEDNAVKIAGVKVGTLEKIRVEHRAAILVLRVDESIELHEDAVALVRAKSLLGEKYLQLDPGSLDKPVLPTESEISFVQSTFEMDEMLNALEPFLGDEDSIGAVVKPLIGRLDGMLAAANGDDGGEPIATREDLQKSFDDVQASIASVRRMTEGNEQEITELIHNSNKVMGDPRIPRIIGNVDRITSTTAKRLPGLLDRTDKAIANLERVSEQMTPERAEGIGKAVDDLTVASANLRTLSEELEGVGKDVGPLISSLTVVAKRAATIDELTLRRFLQDEGIRVTLRTRKGAKNKIDDLEDE